MTTSSQLQRTPADLLIHYFEVNFDTVASELAVATARASPNGAGNGVREQEIAAAHLREFIRALIRARKGGAPPEDIMLTEVDGLSPVERSLLAARGRAVLERGEPGATELKPISNGYAPAAGLVPEPSEVAPPPRRRATGLIDASAVASVLQALATKSLELLNADICQVYLEQENSLTLQAEAPNEPSTITGPGSLALGSGFAGAVLSAGEPLRLADVGDLVGTERIWLDRGMWSLAAVALARIGEPGNGLLVAARSHARAFTDEELGVLDQLADEVGLALASADLLSRAEELAVLKERMKLAREIHDGLASDLSAVVALFKYHEHRRLVDPEDAEQLLVQMRTLVEGSLQSARDILATLRPRPQNIRRLGEVLRRHVEDFGRTYGISAIFSIMGDDAELVTEERDTLYQILRESLTNVRKHSDAGTVEVTIDLRVRPYTMIIQDDGVGIDPGALAEKVGSFGIIGMGERAELLGGTLEVGTSPQGGTRVSLRGPVAPLIGA